MTAKCNIQYFLLEGEKKDIEEATFKFPYKGYRKWVLFISYEWCSFLVRFWVWLLYLKKKKNCIIQALPSAFLIYFPEMTGLAKAGWPLRCLDYTVAMETGVKVLWISSYTDILHITSVLMTGYFTCWPIQEHPSCWFTGGHQVRGPLWLTWGAFLCPVLPPYPQMYGLKLVETSRYLLSPSNEWWVPEVN